MNRSKIQKLLLQVMRRSSFIFEENHVFIEEGNASNKVYTVEEEQDGIDVDGIGNLMDLPKLMLIDEECGNLRVVFDGG